MTQPPGDGTAQPPPGDPWASGPPAPGYPASGPPAPGYPAPSYPASGPPAPGYPASGPPAPGYPASGPPAPGYPVGQQPPGYPPSGYPGGPAMPGYPPPPGQAGPGYPPPAGAVPPKKRRGLLIASISLVVVLLLCGGGGLSAFLLLRDAEDGEGAPDPVAAVESFLRAVYTDKDAAEAAGLVCREARDRAEIDRKVAEVEQYAQTYQSPTFRWDPPAVVEEKDDHTLVSAKLIMTTGDEKISEQELRFTVVQKTGWWVCEVA